MTGLADWQIFGAMALFVLPFVPFIILFIRMVGPNRHKHYGNLVRRVDNLTDAMFDTSHATIPRKRDQENEEEDALQ